MKQFISLLVLFSMALLISPTVKAQTETPATIPFVASTDSLTTADTVFKRITLAHGYVNLGIQVDIKKGTGTLDGKLYLLTSINGGRFVLTDSASWVAVPVNSLVSNGVYTHTAIIQKVAPAGYKYIAYVTQAGSLTVSPTLFSYITRKHD